jgi:hypothetical protein
MNGRPRGERIALAAILDNAYVSLHYGEPSLANELPSIKGYYRVPFGPYVFVGQDPTVAQNSSVIEFSRARFDMGPDVTHFGVIDSETGGDFLVTGALDNPGQILSRYVIRFLEGELKIRCN